MNRLKYILRFPWAEPLGRTWLHFLWPDALVGIVAGAFLRLARRRSPVLRHAVAGALVSVALLAAAVLYSGKLMAQNDDDDPDVPTLVRAGPHGTVADEKGRPIPGARVLLYHAVSYWGLGNQVQEEVVAGTDGGFSFSKPVRFKNPDAVRSLPEYTLFALHPGHAMAWSAVLPETPEDHACLLTLTRPRSETFEVVDKAGHPVEGAVLWLRSAGQQLDKPPSFPENLILPEDIGVCRALTDASGRATLNDLPDTQISAAASKAGCEDEMSCTTPREGVPRFTLKPAGTLAGRVIDPLGQPVPGAIVALYPKVSFHVYFLAKTDADGRYRVENIWCDRDAHPGDRSWGQYSVSVQHPLFTAETREVAFNPGQTITGFDLRAIPGTELEGHLLDPVTKAPVVGATMTVISLSGRQSLFTGRAGAFHGRVPAGRVTVFYQQPPRGGYTVEAEMPSSRQATTFQGTASGERLTCDLYLPGALGRLGTVHGQARTSDGKPAAHCTVAPVIAAGGRLTVGNWFGNAFRGVVADADGNFTLPGMPVGLPFTLSGQTPDGRFRGTLSAKLEAGTLDLPAPLILSGTLPAEVLLTDILGKPRPNLKVTVSPKVGGQNLWTQRRELHSGPDGVLRLTDAAPGGSYEISLPGPALGSQSAQAVFKVPAAGEVPSSAPPALVLSDQLLVRLVGPDGQPIGIKAFQEFYVDLHRSEGVMRWSNGPLMIDGRAGADVLVSRQTLILGKQEDVIHFLIKTETDALVRAQGSFPGDGSGRIVAHMTEDLPADAAPDAGIADVGAQEIAGRAVDPRGTPLADVSAAFPVLPYGQPNESAPVLSGPDGVFRLPLLPGNRYSFLTLSKDGWAPVFLTDVPVGRGFRVALQNTTRLRGVVGAGEPPGRVALLLEKNKFTARADSFDHEVRGIQFRTATDDHGAYDFPMEPGKYQWTATTGDGRFARGEVSLETGQTADLRATLRRGRDVVLDLRDCQTGRPVPGIEVCIMEEGFALISNKAGTERTSDADGRLRWENLPPGKTQFEAMRMLPVVAAGSQPSAYARWWQEGQAPGNPPTGQTGTGSLQVNVDNDGSDPQTIRIQLERGVKVSGLVVDADGQGLAGVQVAPVEDRGGLSGGGQFITRTDSDGRFLACLPAGNGLPYRLCAYFQPWNESVPAASAVSESFQSQPGDERNFRLLMTKGGWFTGRLMLPDGSPAAGFKVTGKNADGLDSAYAGRIATAGADGRFRLGPLRAGKYEIYPGKGPGAPLGKLVGAAEIAGTINADGETRDLGEITLPAGAQLQD